MAKWSISISPYGFKKQAIEISPRVSRSVFSGLNRELVKTLSLSIKT